MPRSIESDSEIRAMDSGQAAVPRARLRLFLALGLIPGLYACRRLPLGLWQMAFGWSLILQIPTVISYLSARRHSRLRAIAGKIARLLLVVTAVTLVLNVLSALDAQEEPVPPEAGVFAVVVVLQVLVAVWSIDAMRHRGADPAEVRTVVIAFAAVIVSALILVPLGRSVPDPVLVVLVAIVAYRVARLRLDRTEPGSPVRRFVAQAVMFSWSVAVISTETEVTTRPGGFIVASIALIGGLIVLVTLSHDGTVGSRLARTPLVAVVGLAFLAILAVLIPSEQSAHWLHSWNFDTPDEFTLAGERYENGDLERWYDTQLDPIDAQLAAHEGFSGLVSEWAGPEPLAINGHVWGYRLDVRVWAVGIDGPRSDFLPADRLCKTETGTCVLIELRRSDDLDEGPSTPLILGE